MPVLQSNFDIERMCHCLSSENCLWEREGINCKLNSLVYVTMEGHHMFYNPLIFTEMDLARYFQQPGIPLPVNTEVTVGKLELTGFTHIQNRSSVKKDDTKGHYL